MFDVGAKANVSRTSNFKEIQGQIAYWLLLEEIESKKGTDARADVLRDSLQKEKDRKILIILDNLWEELDLKKVGIPCGHDNKVVGCKLLLTSRFKDVLHRDMRSDKEFHVSALKEEEARRLFKKIVGSKVDDLEFKPLVDEALKISAGLPLLILSVAQSLKYGTPKTRREYLKAIKVSNEKGADENQTGALIRFTIEQSCNHLRSEHTKALFLTCGLVGISDILVRDLLIYSIGQDLFGRDCSMEDAWEGMKTLIRSLQDSCLLLESDNDDIVKIHDHVREAAVSIASKGGRHVLVMRNDDYMLKEWPVDKLKNILALCRRPQASREIIMPETKDLHNPFQQSFAKGPKFIFRVHG